MKNIISGITKLWWVPLITGLVSIALGIWCLCSPSTSLPVMADIFTIIFILIGIFNVVFGAMNCRTTSNGGWTLALGLLEIAAGIWLFTLSQEALTTTFVLIIGIWLIVVAINAIAETFVISYGSAGWTFLSILLLIATIIFAIIFLSSPVATAVAGWLYLGISLISFGVYRLFLASRMNSFNKGIGSL
ncbi:MAG: DUF308 domain-containing protein [Prevotella sp.]|nr:DUF308 domain-containing protein [Bacteroides sp.]MCM1365889.1 DUF308 domain-containing protein [Prevotella sp.]